MKALKTKYSNEILASKLVQFLDHSKIVTKLEKLFKELSRMKAAREDEGSVEASQ